MKPVYISKSVAKLTAKLITPCLTALLVIATGNIQARDAIDSLPNLGSSSVQYLSHKQAEQLGQAFIRQARSQLKFIDDPILLEYLNRVGNRLVRFSDNPENGPTRYSFYLIDNPKINAFAVPGGHIAIHTGLILNAESEAELAAVLAHEIAHITQNHTARNIENNRFDNVIALASVLVAAAAGSAEAAQASLLASNASILERRLAYGRNFEREADANGIRTLSKAGYNTTAMVSFFQKLLNSSRLNSNNAPEFLLTHPLTISRISEAEQRAKSYPIVANPPDTDFLNIKARITASFGDNYKRHRKLLAQQLASKTSTEKNAAAAQYYQYGLTLARANQYENSINALETAINLEPETLQYRIALADVELESGNSFTGLNRLRRLYDSHHKQNEYIGLYYANALILTRNSLDAIPILREAIRRTPNDPSAHIMLSRAYGETDQLFNSYVARAEYHYLRGSFEFSIKQLDNAIALAPNQVQKSILQSKRGKIQTELDELKKALR